MRIPVKHKFRYRLFASADIVGSTAFKVSMANEKQRWAHVFSAFFRDFPASLRACFEELPGEIRAGFRKPPGCLRVWKFVGDEILFEIELENHVHAVCHAIAFKKALHEYSNELSTKHKGKLGLKGTIWGAGFPVANVEVSTPRESSRVQARDFLGPSVDLGFRLASMADLRRIPVSADIAYFLAKAIIGQPNLEKQIMLLASEPRALKGVAGGTPYPMLWIDRLDGIQTAEDKLLNREWTPNNSNMCEYLTELFGNHASGVVRPFIEADESAEFNQVPQEIRRQREDLVTEDRDLTPRSKAPKARGQAINPKLPTNAPVRGV